MVLDVGYSADDLRAVARRGQDAHSTWRDGSRALGHEVAGFAAMVKEGER
jgi:hypothetical protein